jgi:hypothetical protein
MELRAVVEAGLCFFPFSTSCSTYLMNSETHGDTKPWKSVR